MAVIERPACERRLHVGLQTLGLKVDQHAQRQLLDYIGELASWNATHNLTAVRDPRAMVTRHLLDSIAVLDFITGERLADVGSGAGLPGLVLAIVRPRLQVTVIEASRKKAAFLRHVRRRLALDNVSVVQERVEAWQPRPCFDCVIFRAFSAASACARMAGHLVASNGRMLLMKGRDPRPELRDLPPDFRHVETIVLAVPGLDAERHLAILERA